MMDDKGCDGYRGDLNRRCVTIAEVLQAGRLPHLRRRQVARHPATRAATGRKHNWPLQRGFDRFYGTIHGAGSFFDPATLVRDNTLISPFADPEYKPADVLLHRRHHRPRRAVHRRPRTSDHADKPFFLYVAYTAAHWPMHALPEDIAKYKGKYDAGYEPIRKARFDKADEARPDRRRDCRADARRRATGTRSRTRRGKPRCMEVYAAMIDRMDQGIGRIVAELEAHGPARQHADPLPAGQRRLRRSAWAAAERTAEHRPRPTSRRCRR